MENLVCAKATIKHPDGRTGTPAGYQAHARIGEKACVECMRGNTEASRSKQRKQRPGYYREYTRKNAERLAAYNRDRRDRRQDVLDELKSVPCADCGGTFPPVCMDFDHVRGVKLFSVSRASTRSIETVLKEIEKCEVVCANCHRIRTASRLVRKHPKKTWRRSDAAA